VSQAHRELTDLDRVIHEPARLSIVALLYAVKEADFLYLQRESGLTKGNLSSHLAKLEENGYVKMEKTYKGKLPLTLLTLTAAGRQAFERYRETLQRALTSGSR
jgi:DNA-binding MarR family transcriptional regulator